MSIKQERMEDRIQQILSHLLLREVADPRLQAITITDVQLDPELRSAKVFVNTLGDESRESTLMPVLRRARGFLRREVGRRIRLRLTPELHFHWDYSYRRAERIHDIIDRLDIPEARADETPDAG